MMFFFLRRVLKSFAAMIQDLESRRSARPLSCRLHAGVLERGDVILLPVIIRLFFVWSSFYLPVAQLKSSLSNNEIPRIEVITK